MVISLVIKGEILSTLCLLSNFSCFFFVQFFRLLIFFNIIFSPKILSGISSECQTVWIQIRSDILSGLILYQTVCKSYQQTILVGKELRPFSSTFISFAKNDFVVPELAQNHDYYFLIHSLNASVVC